MGEPNYAQRLALEDSHGTVKGYFIEVRDPNCSPEKKRPPTPTHQGAIDMLMALRRHRPRATLTLIELTWNDDVWLTDGDQVLIESASTCGLDLPDGTVATLRYPLDRPIEVWTRAPGQKRARKASGHHPSSLAAIASLTESPDHA